MRRTLHAVVLVMIAALLTALLGSPSLAEAPGKTKVNGKFSVEPTSFTVGQKVKIGANFSDGVKTVTLFRQNGSSWDDVAVDETNEFGNAWFHDYEVDGPQKLYARITEGGTGITETKTLTPVPKAEPAETATGTLTAEPSFFTEGQKVQIAANFDNGEFDVTLFRKSGDVWAPLSKVRSKASGNAYFKEYVVQGGEQLFAQKSNGESTAAETLTVTPINPDSFTENGTLAASGKIQDGRTGTLVANFASGTHQVTLFQKDGSKWKGVGSAKSNSSGDASISGVAFDGPQTFFAVTNAGVRTDVKEIVPADPSANLSGAPKQLGSRVIYVTTNSGGTPTVKGVDYEGKAVLSEGGDKTETLDLETIAVRGNNTDVKPKKPYKLKFDKNQEPFGMAEEKTFVLLANYLDWTLVRSRVAWDIGHQLDGLPWTPDNTYAELFLNGKYVGSYQMVESIKIDENRVNVEKTTGQVIEFDPHYKEDGLPGMSGKTGVKYSWKDPDEFKTIEPGKKGCKESEVPCEDPEGLTNAKIDDMKAKIRQFEDVLYGSDGKRNWATYQPTSDADDWTTYLDMDSAVDYYLAREFTKDQDADMFRSNYFHTNNVDPDSPDKFFMGPIWDFDRSAGATPDDYPTGVSKPTGWWMRGNGSNEHDTNKIHWYTRIAKDPRFLDALEARWAEKRSVFAEAGRPGVSRAVTAIGGTNDYALGRTVAENDRARWKGYGSRYSPKTSNYGSEVEWLRNWYEKRFTWMDSQLN